jgi:hypothetical protein
VKRLAIFQIVLAAVILTVLHPDNQGEWLACLVILVAGEIVVYRDLRMLNGPAFRKEKPQRASGSPASPPPTGDWGNNMREDRRADGIYLRPSDSVEQIARTMVAAGFRHASMKYHPDHGGSNDLMARIVQARTMLLSALRR